MKTCLSTLSVLALAAGVSACGPAPAPEAPVTNQPGTGATPAAATPCPSGDALLETAARTWGNKPSIDGIYADCVALTVGGETLWYLEGSWDGGDSVGLWSSLLTPAGEVRWVDGADDFPPGALERSGNGNLQAIDLDGDGSDELVFESSFGRGGWDERALTVMRVTASSVTNVTGDGGLMLLSDNSAAVEPAEVAVCEGAYAFVDASGGARRLEITYTGDCEKTGVRAWVLDGAMLTEVTP